MIQIVPFSSQHGKGVGALIVGIQRDEFQIPITLEDQPDLQDIPAFYQQGAGNFWVALSEGEVVGTVALLDLANHQGALRKMFVHADYRGPGHGVSARLLETLLEWSRARDVREVYLGTTEKFLAAHRFYERNGFQQIAASELPPGFPKMAVDTRFYRLALQQCKTIWTERVRAITISVMSVTLDPSPILQTAFGFWSSKVLLSAVELGVFTILKDQKMMGTELAKEIGMHPRGISDFFDALVAMKFLEREGDGAVARYSNTPLTALYLDRDSPRYIGGILEMLNGRLFEFWNDLPEALRTGKPQNEIKHSGKGMFEELYADPARLEQFLGGMTGLSRLNFEAFADKFDFGGYQTLCDVGGATGLLCMEVAKRQPHMRCTSFDLPVVEPIAQRSIAAAGLADRVNTASGDFFADPLPEADVITMGMILHDWNLERKKRLIRAAYDALPPGGAFVAIEALIDDARRENLFGLLMSLNMLIEFGDAFDYSGADFQGWCREAGFERFEVIHLFGPSSAAVAYKK